MHKYAQKIFDDVYRIDLLSADNAGLKKICEEMSLGLSSDEIIKVKEYFSELGRNPSDIELHAVAQAWSEHSCYKSSRVYLKEYFSGTDTADVLAKEDAGVMALDDEYAYALRIESHNHPSAVEPYGGSATGIGGIVRDVLSMGAKPVALIDPLFFAPLDTPSESVPKGVKHPVYLFSGVVSGIRDYGNRIGVPTISGMVDFNEGYLANCLVNVGCVGVMKKSHLLRSMVKNKGTLLVMTGGRTGRDGIHGVNFASIDLSENSETEARGAVQLGDPIMKEPLIHACLECTEKGLLEGLKDLGGGGLSSVVGEMVLAGGLGAEVQLEKVKLKEPGMVPWEIWVSESQERMMLAVSPSKLDEVMSVFEKFDVEATVIGLAIESPVVKIMYHGNTIMDMDIRFFSEGPEYRRPMTPPPAHNFDYSFDKISKNEIFKNSGGMKEFAMKVISHPNVSSREWIIHQYDHEVLGNTVIKPLSGGILSQSHNDASVIAPFPGRMTGLALSTASNPAKMSISPYHGAKNTVAEAFSNLLAAGAYPHSISDCLNFGNPEKPQRMWEFHEAVKGIGEMLKSSGIPVPSGNVSFYNESPYGSVPPTAVVLGAGIVKDYRKAITSDIKLPDTHICLIGRISENMGGSVACNILDVLSPVPEISPEINMKKMFDAFSEAANKELILSCHDISTGGLFTAAAEMAMGGKIGMTLDILKLPVNSFSALFSESPFTWLVETNAPEELVQLFSEAGLDVKDIGITGGNSIDITGRFSEISETFENRISFDIEEIRNAWKKYIPHYMGS